MCICQSGYTGNPFTACEIIRESMLVHLSNLCLTVFSPFSKSCSILAVVPTEGPRNPCNPSPCGANAVCKERNGAGSCTCLPEYQGDPYTGCRPECVVNSDCGRSKACVNNKCRDPCPGACGTFTDCRVVNHAPACTCIPGYTGDPFRACYAVQAGT